LTQGSSSYVGGLVGMNFFGSVTNSYNIGLVHGGRGVGGLLGFGTQASLSNSYNSGSVSGSSYVGGLSGAGAGASNYNTGSVSGSSHVGGLFGFNYGTVSNSYSTGSVSGGSYVGGLVGYISSSTVSNSYWDTETSGQASSSGGTGLTSAQMRQMASFTDWDISANGGENTVWRIYEGQTAPLLRSFLTPLTLTAGDTKTYDSQAYTGGDYAASASHDPGHILGTAIYGGAAQGAINAGDHGLTLSGLYSDQLGYDLAVNDGVLTIDQAPLTATARDAGKTYDGHAYSGGNGVTYAGFVNDETSAVLGGSVNYGGDSQGATHAGSYIITPGGLTAGNYRITFNNGALVIDQAPLTVTAQDAGKTYDGQAYSGGNGVSYAGFVNDETSAVLGGALSYGGNSQGAVNAGEYAITPGGLSSGNYRFEYRDGVLAIRAAATNGQPDGGSLERTVHAPTLSPPVLSGPSVLPVQSTQFESLLKVANDFIRLPE